MMSFVARPGWGPMMHGYGYGAGYGWMWLWGPIMMIFWLVLLGVVAWLVMRAVNNRGPARPDGGAARAHAREILAERYARGEISTEEYTERMDRLTASGTPGPSAP